MKRIIERSTTGVDLHIVITEEKRPIWVIELVEGRFSKNNTIEGEGEGTWWLNKLYNRGTKKFYQSR